LKRIAGGAILADRAGRRCGAGGGDNDYIAPTRAWSLT